MACGAKPIGHKKFCRQCGVALNAEQVVCVKCGASLTSKIATVGKPTGFGGFTAIPMKVDPRILQISSFTYIALIVLGAGLGLLTQQMPALLMVSGLIGILICGVFVYLMFQFWNLVPREIAQTTPEKAAWFSLIPLFNFYWLFVCLWGLGKDLNRTLEQRGIDSRINESLLLGYCIIVLVEFGIGFLFGFFEAIGRGITPSFLIPYLYIGLAGVKGAAIYSLYTSSKSLVEGHEEYKNPLNPTPIFAGVGGMLLVLVLISVGMSYFGGGSNKLDPAAVDELNRKLDERVRQSVDKQNEEYNKTLREIERINRSLK
jgi:hypothetical protein